MAEWMVMPVFGIERVTFSPGIQFGVLLVLFCLSDQTWSGVLVFSGFPAPRSLSSLSEMLRFQ